MDNRLRELLLGLLEPSVTALGFELVDVECHAGRAKGLVRLYIDRRGGVTLDDCAEVSEEVSGLLDVEDPFPGAYVLEVSSPGVDRVLRTRAHFETHLGRRVKLQLKQLREGRRRYTGTLLELQGEDLVLQLDEGTVRVPLALLERARLAPES